jgi:hypothetical protein
MKAKKALQERRLENLKGKVKTDDSHHPNAPQERR